MKTLIYHNYADEELLLSLRAGEEGAFNEIYHRYWKLLFSVAVHKLNDISDAEEVVQDIFADLWKRRSEICITYSLKAFLAGAAKHAVYTTLAKHSRLRQKESLTGDTIETVDMFSTEEVIRLKNLENCIAEAAGRLPERCRLVYQLSREAGYSNKQIAYHLHISEKTVENQITRALRRLRTAVQGFISLF